MSGVKEYGHPLVDFLVEFVVLCLLGAVVGLVMALLANVNFVKSTNRHIADILMRELARERLADTRAPFPRLVDLDISEKACEAWARSEGTSCTLGLASFRRQITAITNNLAQQSNVPEQRPRLVILDIEMAPSPSNSGQEQIASDNDLCAAIYALSETVPVIVPRPTIIGPNGVRTFASILRPTRDGIRCGQSGTVDPGKTNVWFGSPLLQADSDGVVRSVHAWDTFRDGQTNQPTRTAGIGMLAAALLNPLNKKMNLSCLFPGSAMQPAPDRKQCGTGSVRLGNPPYTLAVDAPVRIDRLQFLLPYVTEDTVNPDDFGLSPSSINVLNAATMTKDDMSQLGGAVVVIGGSFATSGDLHNTPLQPNMPGVMVHANAVRAYADGALIHEGEDISLEALLIAVAAAINALVHVLSLRSARRHGAISGVLIHIMWSALGILLAAATVFIFGISWAFSELVKSGTVLAVLTPAAVIVVEGFFNILHEIRRIVHMVVRSIGLKKYVSAIDEVL